MQITNWKAKITMAFMQYVVVTKREKNLKTKVHEITNARNPLNIVALTYYLLKSDDARNCFRILFHHILTNNQLQTQGYLLVELFEAKLYSNLRVNVDC